MGLNERLPRKRLTNPILADKLGIRLSVAAEPENPSAREQPKPKLGHRSTPEIREETGDGQP
jgi:hypothetical protein